MCREKTFFNPEKHICDWPENVDTSSCTQYLKEDDEVRLAVNLTE